MDGVCGVGSELEAHILRDERGTVLAVSGEIDMASAAEFTEALRAAQRNVAGALLVDMRQVTFMDSTGLGALARAGTVSPLKVLPSPMVARVLRITGLLEHFGVPENEAFDSL